ncbi:MAG: CPBP family intramembrane glutamic endopeptidase [Balneolaceae bacterium]
MTPLSELKDDTPVVHIRSWVERNGFSHWAVALIWIVIGFFLFQITAGIVSAILIFTFAGEGLDSGTDVLQLFTERLDLVFIGNTAGQILFLGIATYLVSQLHVQSRERNSFLRIRTFPTTWAFVGIAAGLFVVVQPVIWYLGYLNSMLPVPERFTELQQSQYQMIETFLRSDGAMWLGLLHIGLVPAVCEEIMFRGYVQRAFEKSWGPWPAIILSGLLFGLYHIQLTNLLPLAALGILLALVTWLSGSLLPAIVAHFINNGGAVVLATFYPDLAFADITPETAPPIWMLLLSIATAAVLISLLFRQSETRSGGSD